MIEQELINVYNLNDIIKYGRGWRRISKNTSIYFNPDDGYIVIEINLDNNDQYYFKIHGNKIVHKFKIDRINEYHWRKVRNGSISIGLTTDIFEQSIFIEDHIDMVYADYKVLMQIYYSLKDVDAIHDIYN